jgi:histidinol-phosphatase (PHP family)
MATPILKMAKRMGIMAVPGDDSHSIDEVGGHVDKAIQILKQLGFSTQWPTPMLIT